MSASVTGVQQHEKSPIGAIAERLAARIHLLCHGLQRQVQSHAPVSFTRDVSHRTHDPRLRLPYTEIARLHSRGVLS